LAGAYNADDHGDATFVLVTLDGGRAHRWNFWDTTSVPGMSEEDVDRTVAFVRENQRIEGFEPYPAV